MTDETRRDREDEAFAAFLRRHEDAYNPPPETPVEAIWEGVRKARDDEGRRGVVPIASRRWLLPALAVAAVLLLGIAIGRISMRQAAEIEGPAGPPVATRTEAPPAADSTDGPAPEDGPPAEPGAPANVSAGDIAATAPTTDRPSRPTAPARRPTRPDAPPAAEPGPNRPAEARDLYRLASVQMLAQAEALLVDYRSGRAAGRDDAGEIGLWTRDVLASTRLLLGSPAARDPATRSLLEDLELVLAQIVHHTGADPIEGDMIDRSIEERDLIPRLRTAIPSGDAASL